MALLALLKFVFQAYEMIVICFSNEINPVCETKKMLFMIREDQKMRQEVTRSDKIEYQHELASDSETCSTSDFTIKKRL